LRKIENQALELISIQTKDEWCCRSYQQEYQENYAEDGIHIQELT
jgi:hypothetical protein